MSLRLYTLVFLLASPAMAPSVAIAAMPMEDRTIEIGVCNEVWSATAECFGAREAETARILNGWRLWRALSARSRLHKARAISESLGIKHTASLKVHMMTVLALGQGSSALRLDLENLHVKVSSDEQTTSRTVGNDTPYLTLGFSIRW